MIKYLLMQVLFIFDIMVSYLFDTLIWEDDMKFIKIGSIGLILVLISIAMMLPTEDVVYSKSVDELPEIEGQIYNYGLLTAPLSGERVVCFQLQTEGRYLDSSEQWYKEVFFLAAGSVLKIDGEEYYITGDIHNAIIIGGTESENDPEHHIINYDYTNIASELDVNFMALGKRTEEGAIETDSNLEPTGIREIIFRNGDTIRFKGRIEGNTVIFLCAKDIK